MSADGGEFIPWLTDTSANEAVFTGESGVEYSFYSSAKDNVGNREMEKTVAEATTRIGLNQPPEAIAGVNQILECTSPTGTSVELDASGSADPDGDSLAFEWKDSTDTIVGSTAVVNLPLPLGEHEFTLTVSDGRGGVASAMVTVTVQDTVPPELNLMLLPNELWPANHKLQDVEAAIEVSDACDAVLAVVLLSITSNEPDNGLGDGDTENDIQGTTLGTDDRDFQLRAERAATGQGRVYTVTYSATDASGNETVSTGEVLVPISRGIVPTPPK